MMNDKFRLLIDTEEYYCMREGEGACLVLWVVGPPDASFRFYLKEAFQSQTNTEKILYNKSR